ncbi:MAG: DUF2169 domain-containing protein [Polyangiaceae bacterium]
MGHPDVENQTPLVFEPLFLVDEEFCPIFVPVIKGTFRIGDRGDCQLAEEQAPLSMEGELWSDDPATSSYKYEPEVAFFKPATDVVLVGHAHAPHSGATEVNVGLNVGSLRKSAIVFGDRLWFRSAGAWATTRPVPFEKMPLTYERAFGGWDRSHPDPNRHAVDVRNPVGTGFGPAANGEARLPNIEDPSALIRQFGERPPPAGFGFVSPHWQPRAALSGTFDAAWLKERSPRLPKNFDRRHFNAASAGLVAQGYLRGDEAVTTIGTTREGRLSFNLPAMPAPEVRVVFHGKKEQRLVPNLDTVIIEPDERRVLLLWRAWTKLRTGPQDVSDVEVTPRKYLS